MYKSLLAADQAEVNRAALMIEGRTVMPEFWMAITKGEPFASELPRERPGSFDGTSRPIMKVPLIVRSEQDTQLALAADPI